MSAPWSRHLLWLATAVTLLLVLTATPAAAHTVSGVAATNYESVLVSSDRPADGVRLKLRDLGRRVEVRNVGPSDLVIFGYRNDRFLRVGPTGVYENLRSPTLYENRSTITGQPYPIPPEASPDAPPDWHRVNGAHIVRWRDRRTRHEGAAPPAVVDAPRQTHLLSTWRVPMELGGNQIGVTGAIRYRPPPSSTGWLLGAAIIATVVFLADRSRSWRAQSTGAAAAVLIATDIVHSGVAVAPIADSALGAVVRFGLGGAFSVVAWVAGAVAVSFLADDRLDAPYLLGFCAFVILLTGGLGDVAILGRSQVPYAVSGDTGRALVSLTLGLGTGLLAASIRRLRLEKRRPSASATLQRPTPTEEGR